MTISGGNLLISPHPFSKLADPNSNLVKPVFLTPVQSLVAHIEAEAITFQISEIFWEKTALVHKLWNLDTTGISLDDLTPEGQLIYSHYLEG